MINAIHGILSQTGLPTTGIVFDYNAFKGLGLSGSNVSTWSDQSGNGITAIGQSTPKYLASGINGFPAIDTSAGGFATDVSKPIAITARSYYMVVQVKGNHPTRTFSSLLYQDQSPFVQLYLPNGGGANVYITSGAYGSGTWVAGVPMVVKVRVGSTSGQLTLNGVTSTFTYPAITANNIQFLIATAGGFPANVLLGRCIVYNHSLSDADDARVETILKNQFNINY